MSEKTENNANQAANSFGELNKVEGFNPEQYVRDISDDGRNPRKYLEVKWRLLWFRMKYPHGKITTHIIDVKDKYAIIGAKVYVDKNDPPENFIASAVAQRWADAGKSFGNRFVEIAETGAIGRALGNAGFGSQFCCDKNESDESDIVDSPIESNFPAGQLSDGEIPDSDMPFELYRSDTGNSIPMNSDNRQNDNITQMTLNSAVLAKPEKLSAPVGVLVNKPNSTVNSADTKPAIQDESSEPTPETKPQQNNAKYTKATPVNEIYRVMQLDEAKNYTVTFGKFAGKTIEEIAADKLSNLDWYINSYSGQDNVLRAAATIIREVVANEQLAG
ncbi:MAG: hypothetical protein FWD71_21185 [Oscillospiraceae bacterium]|nr:hypothetical protein [Oscillospiraceae bacterium]